MKKNIALQIILLGTLFLTSCGTESPVSSSSSSISSSSNVSSSTSLEPPTDVPDVASGDYIVSKYIYRIDKPSKNIKILDYDQDYFKYDRNQSTLVEEVTFSYDYYGGDVPAMRFQSADGGENYIYAKGGTISHYKKKGGSTTMQSISLFPLNPPMPIMNAQYVSKESMEQYKVDIDGNRIPDGQGGYVKETFYLFLKLTPTKAELFAWDSKEGHGSSPFLAVENFKYSYNKNGIMLVLPHKDDSKYSCRITVEKEDSFRFVNDYEKYGDYSGSGLFEFLAYDPS